MRTLALLLLAVFFAFPAFAADKESVYDRVMRTGTIRCGYYIWPPFLEKDVNTSQISGIAYDMMEKIGELLSLKIEWTAEVNFDAMFEGYGTGRYDMVCGPLSPTPARARASDFTRNVFFAAYYLYAGNGDTRFDNDYAKANAPDIRYASLDGDMNAVLGNEEFPLAQKVSIGQNAANTDPLMMIATGKADVSALEPVAAMGFMRANPDKIRQVSGPPVRVMPISYSIPLGEEKLKAMLNVTIQTLLDAGLIDKAFKKYPDYDATILRVAPEYRAQEAK